MTDLNEHPVLEKNRRAAQMWNSGGADYDLVSQAISAAIDHAVTRLAPRKGERVLDIATGTGFTARLAASRGARVTGVDIAETLLSSAADKAKAAGLAIDWRLGDAERLPFADAAFDAAISTFGIMFATDQEAAVTELARVIKPGGRFAIAAWTPDSEAVDMRKVLAPYIAAPPATAPMPPSPFNWGDPEWLRISLGDRFVLGFERAEVFHRISCADEAWQLYSTGFGPVRSIAQGLPEDRCAAMRRDFTSWVEQFVTEIGVAIPFRYLVVSGRSTAAAARR